MKAIELSNVEAELLVLMLGQQWARLVTMLAGAEAEVNNPFFSFNQTMTQRRKLIAAAEKKRALSARILRRVIDDDLPEPGPVVFPWTGHLAGMSAYSPERAKRVQAELVAELVARAKAGER